MKPIIISAASDAGVTKDGAKDGAIKIGKYLENLNNEVFYINNSNNFIKDKDPQNKRKNEEEINNFNEKIYQTIVNNSNCFPLTIGGDHSIAIGSALASEKCNDNIGIIWFDAHPDFNTFETTITGNIHGLPLAAITAFGNDSLTSFHKGNFVKYQNVCVVGARSIDDEEKINLEKAGIKIFTTEDINALGLSYVIREALKIASQNTNGIHLSYDLDVIDPLVAPGVSVPEKNGIALDLAYEACDLLLNDMSKIVSIDLVEFNPIYDKDEKTYKIIQELLKKILMKIKEK